MTFDENKLAEYIEDRIVNILSDKLAMILDFPLSIHQVATLTGRKEKTIYKMCERGHLTYTKKKKSIFINLRDLGGVLDRVSRGEDTVA